MRKKIKEKEKTEEDKNGIFLTAKDHPTRTHRREKI